MLQEQAEITLLHTTRSLRRQVDALITAGRFNDALMLTAQLHGPVTVFFDKVMVNVDDERLRNNRFALLQEVAGLTNRVANISRLATAGC